MVSDCLFCKITAKELPSQTVFENDLVMVIKDIKPVAPVHLLVIPKKHIDNVCDGRILEPGILAAMYSSIQEVARSLNITENGFRLITNLGRDAGETIPHFHIHIIAGRQLDTSMG
jgi:histidine triad (HIT) family protein